MLADTRAKTAKTTTSARTVTRATPGEASNDEGKQAGR